MICPVSLVNGTNSLEALVQSGLWIKRSAVWSVPLGRIVDRL